MKTKNRDPNERTAVVPVKKAPVRAAARQTVKKGTPKFELEGNKWVVEFQDEANLSLDETEPKQTVYLYKNDNTVWGSTGTERASGPAAADGLSVQAIPYTARIYQDQATPAAGSYTDNVVVDVSF